MNDRLSAKQILTALESKAVISPQKAGELYSGRHELLKRFGRQRGKEGRIDAGADRDLPFVFIDAIVALNL